MKDGPRKRSNPVVRSIGYWADAHLDRDWRRNTTEWARRLFHPVSHYYWSNTVLIQVGRCGGTTLKGCIRRSELKDTIQPVHIRRPVYYEDVEYVIIARNPVMRAISAFNWRQKGMIDNPSEQRRFRGEYAALCKYPTINALAEALYDDGAPVRSAHREASSILHIRENHAYYLKAFLDKCPPDRIKAVLMQENLTGDMKRIFGIDSDLRRNDNSQATRTTTLSRTGFKNLRQYLHDDYTVLDRLKSYGKIDDDTFKRAMDVENLVVSS